jgi:hypothetical protein
MQHPRMSCTVFVRENGARFARELSRVFDDYPLFHNLGMPPVEVDPEFLRLVRWAHARLEQANHEPVASPQQLTEALDSLVKRGVMKNSVKNGKRSRGLNVDLYPHELNALIETLTEPEVLALCSWFSCAGAVAGILPPWPVPQEHLDALTEGFTR